MSGGREAPRPAGFRAVALAVAWRSVHNFVSNPAFLLPAVVFPLFFFVAFAGGLSAIANTPGFDFPNGYTAFQFVFVLLQSAAFGGVFTGFAIARDFEIGFANRYLLAAANRNGIVAGYALAALTRAVVTWTVLTAIALVAGMEVGGAGVELFGLYGLAVLTNLAATMWAAGVAMRVRSIQGGPLMQFPVFLILFLAPVYVPLEPAQRLDPRGRLGQPGHRPARGRAGLHLRRTGRRRPRLRDRRHPADPLRPLGPRRPQAGRSGRLRARSSSACGRPSLADATHPYTG